MSKRTSQVGGIVYLFTRDEKALAEDRSERMFIFEDETLSEYVQEALDRHNRPNDLYDWKPQDWGLEWVPDGIGVSSLESGFMLKTIAEERQMFDCLEEGRHWISEMEKKIASKEGEIMEAFDSGMSVDEISELLWPVAQKAALPTRVPLEAKAQKEVAA